MAPPTSVTHCAEALTGIEQLPARSAVSRPMSSYIFADPELGRGRRRKRPPDCGMPPLRSLRRQRAQALLLQGLFGRGHGPRGRPRAAIRSTASARAHAPAERRGAARGAAGRCHNADTSGVGQLSPPIGATPREDVRVLRHGVVGESLKGHTSCCQLRGRPSCEARSSRTASGVAGRPSLARPGARWPQAAAKIARRRAGRRARALTRRKMQLCLACGARARAHRTSCASDVFKAASLEGGC